MVNQSQIAQNEGSCISRIFMWWLFPILKSVYVKKNITQNEIPKVEKNYESSAVYENFYSKWKTCKKKSILWSLACFTKTQIIGLALGCNILSLLPIVQTSLAAFLVEYFNKTVNMPAMYAYIYAGGIILSSFLYAVLNTNLQYHGMKLGMKIQVALGALIYEQVLQMSSRTMQIYSYGEILTFLSTDLEVIKDATKYIHNAFSSLIMGCIISVLVYKEMGLPGLSGILYCVIVTVFTCAAQPLSAKLRGLVAKHTEDRVMILKNVIRGIETIKVFGWETPFTRKINLSRRREVCNIGFILCWQTCIQIFAHLLAVFPQGISILVFVYYGGVLNPQNLVRVIGFMYIFGLQLIMTGHTLTMAGMAYKSVRRIETFAKDNYKDKIYQDRKIPSDSLYHLTCEGMTSSWDTEQNKEGQAHLRNITVQVKKGDFMIVIGPSGAGKTMLLMTLLEDLDVIHGSFMITDSTSYAPQQPWICSGSIRENILLGAAFDQHKYDRVIHACGLLEDLDRFPARDFTLVGERGITLSGGQMSRIGLARAVYQDKELILMDDPLSAVDSKVGDQIIDRCIKGFLSDKTRILVTHQVHYASEADIVMVINKEGECSYSGNFEGAAPFIDKEILPYIKQNNTDDSVQKQQHIDSQQTQDTKDELKEEDTKNGSISWRVYWGFFTAGRGWLTLLPALILTILGNGALKYSEWYLSKWSEIAYPVEHQILINSTYHVTNSMRLYGTILGAYALYVILLRLFVMAFVLVAVINLHHHMLANVMGAKMSFFGRPLGIIMNRFTRDLGMIDMLMWEALVLSFNHGMLLLAVLIYSCVIMPWLILAIIPLVSCVLLISRFGLTGIREFRRLEAACKSPIFSHTSNTLEGRTSIKAMKKEEFFMKTFHSHQNTHTSAYHLFLSGYIWMGLYTSLASVGYYAAVVIAAFTLQATSGAVIGVLLVLISQAIDMVQRLLIQAIEVNMMMTSVERILCYTKIPQEEVGKSMPTYNVKSEDFSREGCISFNNISLKYENTDSYALKDINFSIDDGEKIGIIGRTGSGKSSIFRALTRMVDYEGNITINGADISNLPLERHRKYISVIPQDPVIMVGTLRSSLDPFEEYEDADIWSALQQIRLDGFVRSLPLGLHTTIGDGHRDMSAGQKQLLALARAMLRHSKIILLDEATANVDMTTDAIIQDAIQTVFKECTVLTIAHRIRTIEKYDRIMVLSKGMVVAFGDPNHILHTTQEIMSDTNKDCSSKM